METHGVRFSETHGVRFQVAYSMPILLWLLVTKLPRRLRNSLPPQAKPMVFGLSFSFGIGGILGLTLPFAGVTAVVPGTTISHQLPVDVMAV